MRKSIKLIILFLIIFTMVFLLIGIFEKINIEADSSKKIEMLPHFSFKESASKQFTDVDLKGAGKTIIISYFSPECDHCQYMTTSFLRNATRLKNISVLMITVADSESISKFKRDFHLDSMQNVVILQDAQFQFKEIFGTSAIPCFFVYKNKRLRRKIIGATKIENLLN